MTTTTTTKHIAADEQRCDRTDLLPSACAHCRGLTLDPALIGADDV